MTRRWNEAPSIENDQKELALHLVQEHAANPIAAYAAPFRMLRDAHADYHKVAVVRAAAREGEGRAG